MYNKNKLECVKNIIFRFRFIHTCDYQVSYSDVSNSDNLMRRI